MRTSPVPVVLLVCAVWSSVYAQSELRQAPLDESEVVLDSPLFTHANRQRMISSDASSQTEYVVYVTEHRRVEIGYTKAKPCMTMIYRLAEPHAWNFLRRRLFRRSGEGVARTQLGQIDYLHLESTDGMHCVYFHQDWSSGGADLDEVTGWACQTDNVNRTLTGYLCDVPSVARITNQQLHQFFDSISVVDKNYPTNEEGIPSDAPDADAPGGDR